MEAHRRYHYHANAHVLSAHLTRPIQHIIEVQAATSLPTTGGVGRSRVENFRFQEVVSFKAGYSHVSGSEKSEGGKTIHTTHATAAVEGLNILDVVTADRIVVRLSSSFPGENSPDNEGRIVIVGTKFENLRVAGCPIEVELHHELALDLGTFAEVKSAYTRNEEFKKLSKEPKKAPGDNGVVYCSLVKHLWLSQCGSLLEDAAGGAPPDVKVKRCHGVKRSGHTLKVEEFGTIHLAEILFEHGRKTVTMMRVELGSPNGGLLTLVEGSTNGRPPS